MPQVSEKTFDTEKQQIDWLEKKVAPFANPEFPPRIHPDNFRLSEYYYERDMGKNTSQKTTIEENMGRKGCDMASAGSMVAPDEPVKGAKKVDMTQKHKQMLSKTMHHMKRLASTITSTETKMPSLKRRVGDKSYELLKKGLAQSRTFKESCLEEMEDYKQTPTEEKVESVIEALGEMSRGCQDHVGALVEAVKTFDMIKKPPAEQEEGDPFAASSRSWSTWHFQISHTKTSIGSSNILLI